MLTDELLCIDDVILGSFHGLQQCVSSPRDQQQKPVVRPSKSGPSVQPHPAPRDVPMCRRPHKRAYLALATSPPLQLLRNGWRGERPVRLPQQKIVLQPEIPKHPWVPKGLCWRSEGFDSSVFMLERSDGALTRGGDTFAGSHALSEELHEALTGASAGNEYQEASLL